MQLLSTSQLPPVAGWLAGCSNAIILFLVPQVLIRSASSSSSSSSIQSMSSDDQNQKTVPEKKLKIYTGD
jgi:hypothetical protein